MCGAIGPIHLRTADASGFSIVCVCGNAFHAHHATTATPFARAARDTKEIDAASGLLEMLGCDAALKCDSLNSLGYSLQWLGRFVHQIGAQ